MSKKDSGRLGDRQLGYVLGHGTQIGLELIHG
jgi:hypothetical protein